MGATTYELHNNEGLSGALPSLSLQQGSGSGMVLGAVKETVAAVENDWVGSVPSACSGG